MGAARLVALALVAAAEDVADLKARLFEAESCKENPANQCSTAGLDAAYAEAIVGGVRQIRGGGCPNTDPLTNCLNTNPRPAAVQDWIFDVPAAPRFNAETYEASLDGAFSLHDVGGIVAIMRNGVEVRSCYGGQKYGPCWDWDSSAVKAEGVDQGTFEYCGGHGNPHHYHAAPVCLLAQMGPEADGSSPQLGWAADGFPVMGPRGPGGVPMKRCGYGGADATYCVDACGGYYGAWNGGDDFLYRYFMLGDDEVVLENPNRRWTADFFPHAPFCLLGCGSVVADGNDRDPSIGRKFPACGTGATPGTRAGYAAAPLAGVTAASLRRRQR